MDQNTASILSIISALAGLFAAIAAFRSAGIAKDAARHAQEVERRELQRDVISAAQSIIAETMSVDDLAIKLKRGYKELAIFCGRSGSRKRIKGVNSFILTFSSLYAQ